MVLRCSSSPPLTRRQCKRTAAPDPPFSNVHTGRQQIGNPASNAVTLSRSAKTIARVEGLSRRNYRIDFGVDLLSTVLEVSETFDCSREMPPAAAAASRSSKRKTFPPTMEGIVSRKTSVLKWIGVRASLLWILRKTLICYEDCMLGLEAKGNLAALGEGGMPYLQS